MGCTSGDPCEDPARQVHDLKQTTQSQEESLLNEWSWEAYQEYKQNLEMLDSAMLELRVCRERQAENW